MRERHQQANGQGKGYADPQQATAQEYAASAAHQARPYEQPGEKEQERDQVDVLERAKDVEPEPALGIDNRNTSPSIGRIVEVE